MNYELRMKFFAFIALIIISLILISRSLLISQDEPVRSGSIIFIEAKCNKCHSVNSQVIECSSSNSFASDLSKVGDSLESEIIKDYLKKKIKLNNKKHPVVFKGKQSDLDILCNWLQNLSSVVF